MHLHYDKNMIIEKRTEDEFIIYSPCNHNWIRGNKFVCEVVKVILNNKGDINLQSIIDLFRKEYNQKLTTQDLEKLIQKLNEAELFFYTPNGLNKSRQKAVEKHQLSKQQPLKKVYLHPTLKCNFDCSYCYNQDILGQGEELTTEQWIDIIEGLKQNHSLEKIVFTGGEPLIRDDLEEIIKKTTTETIKYVLLTNGSLLKERFDKLVPYLDKVVLSLDSFDLDVNILNRSQKGFEDILELIKLFSNYNPDKLVVRSVVTKNNYEDIKEFSTKLFKKYGIKSKNNWFIPNNKEEINKIPDCKHYFNVDQIKKRDPHIAIPGMKINRCEAASTVIAVNPEGDIYPCQNLLREDFKITNILKDNWYQKLLASDIRKKFQGLSVDKIEKCKQCSYRYLCGGGCPADAYKVYGDITEPVEYFCDYLKKKAKSILKVADVDDRNP